MNLDYLRRLSAVLFFAALLQTVQGCGEIHSSVDRRSESRSWDVDFEEHLTVLTEPTGARVYVNDNLLGPSPAKTRLIGGKVHIVQDGTYSVERYYYAGYSGGLFREGHPLPDERRMSPTSWEDRFSSWSCNGNWRVRAFLDGYKEATVDVALSGSADLGSLLRVLKPGADGRLPPLSSGSRTILITLERNSPAAPAPTVSPPSVQQQQQQQQQQTVVIPGGNQPGAPRSGTVTVIANVDGADIHVDGLFVGNAPATLKLTAGVHIIEVKKDGYESFRRELRVLSDGEVSLRAELKKS